MCRLRSPYISEVSNERAATANRRARGWGSVAPHPNDCRRGGRLKFMNRACRPEITIKNGSRLDRRGLRAPCNSSERLRPCVIFAVEAQYCKGHRTTSSSRLFSRPSHLDPLSFFDSQAHYNSIKQQVCIKTTLKTFNI